MIATRKQASNAFDRHIKECDARLKGLTSLQQDPIRAEMARGPLVELTLRVEDVLTPQSSHRYSHGVHGYALVGHLEEMVAGFWGGLTLQITASILARMTIDQMPLLEQLNRGEAVSISGYMYYGSSPN